jgi:purine-nucleoside phosphorylase
MSGGNEFQRFASRVRERSVDAAVVLGSGMGPVADRVQKQESLPFSQVPGLEATSVAGHSGRLTVGDWAGRRVLVFEGRLHYYECGSWQNVTAPIHAAHFLGARILLLTNAAGGIHPALHPGCLMLIRRHIEWTRPYCWRKAATAESSASPYSEALCRQLREAARRRKLPIHEGVYAAVTGPCYETAAEIKALQAWGADAVGMSTAREAETARELGIECAAVSLITNRAAGLSAALIHHEEVLSTAAGRAGWLADVLEGFLQSL